MIYHGSKNVITHQTAILKAKIFQKKIIKSELKIRTKGIKKIRAIVDYYAETSKKQVREISEKTKRGKLFKPSDRKRTG